jgi:arylsulfatase A-like enzyme
MERPFAAVGLAFLLCVVAVSPVADADAAPGKPAAAAAGTGAGAGADAGPAPVRAGDWRSSPGVEALRSRVRDMNVLLVMVDALRVRPIRDPAVTARRFPNITALRRRARWFTNAFSPAAGTDLCLGGLLTGNLDPMSGAAFTLPELLSAGGYVTHAVVPREVVRGTSETLLTRGLRNHDIVVTDPKRPNVPAGLSSQHITNLGLQFLDRWMGRAPAAVGDGERPGKRAPFFLWLHYFDLHEHHQLPDDHRAIVAHNQGRVPSNAFQKYNAILKVTDAALGRLFEGLARRGLAEDTIVVFAADHGESLEEEPRLPENHGLVLYNPLVHIPLAIAVPGLEGGDDPHPASLLDVPVTLLDLLGLRTPPSMSAGQSLLPSLARVDPPAAESRTFVLNERDQFAVIQWPYKLLKRRNSEVAELYDLSSDFDESANLARRLPQVVASLSRAYRDSPAINLDRTRAGRKRFEERARRTRPAAGDLAKMAERTPAPPAADPLKQP